MIRRAGPPLPTKQVRCAIYTRKSTDEGLDQQFNSLDAQREAGEAYVCSHKQEGWIGLLDRYDDGGFSGATLERPALRQLLADIEAGRIDAVVCYKVDRLSRSLLDFTKLIEIFDRHEVMFVSVTQPISTADSSGRLMLNVLLSFAQFEREMIADRTRDKMAAARRKGKWTGGFPVLGYDVSPEGGRLVANEDEADTVRQIFELYLDLRSLQGTAAELNRRGWRTKSWQTKEGAFHEGVPFNKGHLSRLLGNPLYIGQVVHRGDVYPGEHPGIVDPAVFDQVQQILRRNDVDGGRQVRNRYGALLRGLLFCSACGCAMTPTSTKKGPQVYRYYVCTSAQRQGWKSCPKPSLSAWRIEPFVIDRIKAIGRDESLIKETLRQARQQQRTRAPQLVAERRRLERERARLREAPLDEHRQWIEQLDGRLLEIAEELAVLETHAIGRQSLMKALSLFDPIWEVLYPREQERIIHLLVERIDYDGTRQTAAITFQLAGIKALADEVGAAKEAQLT